MGVVWDGDALIALRLLYVVSCAKGRESCRALSKGLSRYLCRAMWTLTVSVLILLFRSSQVSVENFEAIFTPACNHVSKFFFIVFLKKYGE